MENGLDPVEEIQVRIVLSTQLVDFVYRFDLHQVHLIPHPNHFDTYPVGRQCPASRIGSLPYIRKSNRYIVRGFVIQFYSWHDFRIEEEGVGI